MVRCGQIGRLEESSGRVDGRRKLVIAHSSAFNSTLKNKTYASDVILVGLSLLQISYNDHSKKTMCSTNNRSQKDLVEAGVNGTSSPNNQDLT